MFLFLWTTLSIKMNQSFESQCLIVIKQSFVNFVVICVQVEEDFLFSENVSYCQNYWQIMLFFPFKNWGAWVDIESYDQSAPKTNTKPVLIERKQIDRKRLKAIFGSIIRHLQAIFGRPVIFEGDQHKCNKVFEKLSVS